LYFPTEKLLSLVPWCREKLVLSYLTLPLFLAEI
jgi:hypothetical protein